MGHFGIEIGGGIQKIMPDWAITLAGQLIMAGAIYGGIRADVKNLHEGVKEAKESSKGAHQRIDTILNKG